MTARLTHLQELESEAIHVMPNDTVGAGMIC